MGNKVHKIALKTYFNPKKKYISFEGDYETEMIKKFNSFNIVWHAPEKDEKLENWIAFTNVDVYKSENIEEFIELYCRNENIIVISSGKYAEKLINEIIQKKLAKHIFKLIIIIYCKNLEYHKNWSKNYKEIVAVTSKPNEIFDCLLKLQKNRFFDISLFSYQISNDKTFNFNYYHDESLSKFIFDDFSLKLNSYEKFCINSFSSFSLILTSWNYNYFNDFFCCFYPITNLLGKVITDDSFSNYEIMAIPLFLYKNNIDGMYKELLKFLSRLCLISFWIAKLPYLYGYLSYNDVEKKLTEKITKDDIRKKYDDIVVDTQILFNSIYNDKILDLKENIHLKELHHFLIDFIRINTEFKSYSKFPLLIKYFWI